MFEIDQTVCYTNCMEKLKYFDNASTTMVDLDIIKDWEKLNEEHFYNPSAIYKSGNNSHNLLEQYRLSLLKMLHAGESDGLIFTGSATESNNTAFYGTLKKNSKILVSSGEHSSNYAIYKELTNCGYNVELVNITQDGVLDMQDFMDKMTRDVSFVSIIHVSNETGAINDIKQIVKYAKSVNPNVIFHSDGTQAVGKIDVNLKSLGVDLYSFSAHKIGGTKGVGALFVKNGVRIKPFIVGGGQEKGLRSGTENILGIYSLYKGLSTRLQSLKDDMARVTEIRDFMVTELEKIDGVTCNAISSPRSPYIISATVDNVRSETLINMLEDDGFIIGNGSACSSKLSGNRVLSAMGVPDEKIRGAIRISMSYTTDLKDAEMLINALKKNIEIYRGNTK